MERVAIYIRVSKKEQAKNKGTESSLAIQLKKCTDYCKEKNYEVLKVYSDVESGGNDDRKGFNDLQNTIPKKIYTKVIFWEVSRIARKISTGMKFFEDLEKYGISFESISQPYLKDFMSLSIFLAWGTEDLKQMSLRIQSNLLEKTKAGYFVHGNPATGYIRGENKMIVPDPEKAPLILKIFETFAENWNLTETARIFGKTRKDITDIIDNRIYIGEVVYGKFVKDPVDSKHRIRKKENHIWYKGLHEPIIPLSLFNHCQEIRKANIKINESRAERKSVLLFSGLVICTCGRKMFQTKRYHTNKAGEKYPYYVYLCANRITGKKHSIAAKKLDKTIIEQIKNSKELLELNNFKDDNESNNIIHKLKLIEKEFLSLEKERERVIKLFQKEFINEDELEKKFIDISSRKKELEKRKKIYEEEKEETPTDNTENFEKLKYIIDNHSEDDVIETRKLLRLLIKEIDVVSTKPLKVNIIFN